MKQTDYIARHSDSLSRLAPDELDFLRRRTRPFLNAVGIGKPIIHLLQEAYLQGMRDSIDVAQEPRP